MMIHIGSQKIETNIFLAPLSGVSDLPYRLIAREHGAEFCFYEMFDSHSLAHTTRAKNVEMLKPHPKDHPIAAQLLGPEPDVMLKAAKRILEMSPDISFLDVNAACPVKKVIKKFSGSYLIKEPDNLYKIIDKLSSSLPLPVTVKLRTGYTKRDPDKIARIANNCEKSGAKAIFVHGRTKAQEYSGDVDHESIKAIKESVKIPVIASGNIFSPQRAKEMIELTGCDGVAVARGSLGNPWIFGQIKSYLEKGEMTPEPALKERLSVLKKHMGYIEKYKQLPEKTKTGHCRKIAVWYLKGFRHAATLRGKINHIKSAGELYELLDALDPE